MFLSVFLSGSHSLSDMTHEQRQNLQILQNLADDDDFDASNLLARADIITLGDVLDGTEPLPLSHAGGELGVELDPEIEEMEQKRYEVKFVHWLLTDYAHQRAATRLAHAERPDPEAYRRIRGPNGGYAGSL
jgi:hypothetical protein